MITFELAQWEEPLRTALGRGGHIVALAVALLLVISYMSGGRLEEHPAKLVIGGFFVGAAIDITVSSLWSQFVASKS